MCPLNPWWGKGMDDIYGLDIASQTWQVRQVWYPPNTPREIFPTPSSILVSPLWPRRNTESHLDNITLYRKCASVCTGNRSRRNSTYPKTGERFQVKQMQSGLSKAILQRCEVSTNPDEAVLLRHRDHVTSQRLSGLFLQILTELFCTVTRVRPAVQCGRLPRPTLPPRAIFFLSITGLWSEWFVSIILRR